MKPTAPGLRRASCRRVLALERIPASLRPTLRPILGIDGGDVQPEAILRAALTAAVVSTTLGCSGSGGAEEPDRMALPPLMLWAWERPEDLRPIGELPGGPQAGRIGVAPLVATITLRSDEVDVRPRHQPLRLPPGVALLPVVRIEADRAAPPLLDDSQRDRVVTALVEVAARSGRDGPPRLQIDFEATASQRAFYRSLLGQLRDRLGPRVPLGITALASWCLGDGWLAGLPVDEVVPMVYRLGPRASEVDEQLRRRGDFAAADCHRAVGLSLDEPAHLPPAFPEGRRFFLFNPRPWTASRIATLGARPPPRLADNAPEHDR